jgi:hypothetical protein
MTRTIILAVLLSMVILPLIASAAHAQPGYGNAVTLEDALKLANQKVVYAEKYQGQGSGTPYFAVDGVLGASLISVGIFGGIASAFFVRSRHGKYAAQGLG